MLHAWFLVGDFPGGVANNHLPFAIAPQQAGEIKGVFVFPLWAWCCHAGSLITPLGGAIRRNSVFPQICARL